jgi:hypothetical protein
MMQVPAIRLTDMQAAFVRETVKGRLPDDAARAAGYNMTHPDIAYRLLQNPGVALAIRFEVNRLLTVEALPLAYNVLKDLAKDPKVPPAVRRACARDLIDRAGFVAPKAQAFEGQGEKPLSEMSSEELRALVDKLESELAGRAVDVSDPPNAPDSAPISAKPLNWLD